MSSVLERVIGCVAESLTLNAKDLEAKTLIIKDLGADSLDVMDIMFQLEEEFDIQLEKEDLNFLNKIQMTQEEAVDENGLVSDVAKNKLKDLLPELDSTKDLKPVDLGNYLSVSSIVKVVEGLVEKRA